MLPFQIYTIVTIGGTEYKSDTYNTVIKVKGGISLSIALAVAFGVVVFIVIVLVACFCVWRRRNPAYLQVVRMEDGTGTSKGYENS